MHQGQFGTKPGKHVSQSTFRIRAMLRSTFERGDQSIPDQGFYFGQPPVPLVGQLLDELCDGRVARSVQCPVPDGPSVRTWLNRLRLQRQYPASIGPEQVIVALSGLRHCAT